MVRACYRSCSAAYQTSLDFVLARLKRVHEGHQALRLLKSALVNDKDIEVNEVKSINEWTEQQYATILQGKELRVEDAESAAAIASKFGDQFLLQTWVIGYQFHNLSNDSLVCFRKSKSVWTIQLLLSAFSMSSNNTRSDETSLTAFLKT